jgi:hypothetical protein
MGDTHTIVAAVLLSDGIDDIGDLVHFYYSGDPTDEVYLVEESNPLWIALFLVFFPFVVGATMLCLLKLRMRRARGARRHAVKADF